ncbi:MAG: LacI family DNA-binding transcriptional regulator [Spirochaetes bacterium]|nr:LacI family DNA-binding transcriptional regulator [Spirochaetota bacterium]
MTLREIAEVAGISIGTVDRVLHGRGRVSVETKEKVEAIIRDSSYKPNLVARQLKLNRRYTFACLIPSLGEDSGYWRIVHNGVQKAARELAPFRVSIKQIEFNRYSETSFHENIQQLFSAEFDGLLMAPVLPEASMALLRRLPADFPVVFCDAQLPGFSPLSRIGQNAFQSGTLAGRMLDALASRKESYCVISTHAEDFHIQKRVEGFLAYFRSKETGTKIRVFECFDIEHKEKREQFLGRLLKEIPDVDGIFVTNASGHGVASYVNENSERHIATIGYDLVPENERQLKAGVLDVILSQRPEYQGYEGIYQLYSHVVLQQEIEKEIIVPIVIFMKENLPLEAESRREEQEMTAESGS